MTDLVPDAPEFVEPNSPLASVFHILTLADQWADTSDDEEALADVLADIADIRKAAAQVADKLEQRLLDVMGRQVEVEGFAGPFERRTSVKRTQWRSLDLLSEVAQHARKHERKMLDAEAGEVEPEWAAVVRVISECLNVSGGKVGGLKRIGFDPSDFCIEEPVEKVVVPKRAES